MELAYVVAYEDVEITNKICSKVNALSYTHANLTLAICCRMLVWCPGGHSTSQRVSISILYLALNMFGGWALNVRQNSTLEHNIHQHSPISQM